MTEVPRSQGFDQPIHHLLFAVLASDSSWWQQNFHPLLQWHSSGSCFRNLPATNNYIRCLVVWFFFLSTYIILALYMIIYIDYIDRIDYIAIEHADFRFQCIQTQVGESDSERKRLQVRSPPPAPQWWTFACADVSIDICIIYIYIYIIYCTYTHIIYIYI